MFVDLSLSLSIDDPIFSKAYGDANSPLSMGHIGTHLDTYLQKPIPLDWSERRGVLIDVRDADGPVGVGAIEGRDIRPGDFVIFYTGYIERHAYGTAQYFGQHPQLDWDLIRKLVELKVSFIGIDAAGIRHGSKLGDEHHRADVYCEEEGPTYVIENLNNLSRLLDADAFDLRVAWIMHRGASGIPAKVVAVV